MTKVAGYSVSLFYILVILGSFSNDVSSLLCMEGSLKDMVNSSPKAGGTQCAGVCVTEKRNGDSFVTLKCAADRDYCETELGIQSCVPCAQDLCNMPGSLTTELTTTNAAQTTTVSVSGTPTQGVESALANKTIWRAWLWCFISILELFS
ncbi:uncharacterized protein LOC135494644 [Lineus longissimus]|uniref:uncharacterized protein LOC135494644 n=1 Tax=Lineus longissimus TaxID=88925 RepID=UPI00315D4230